MPLCQEVWSQSGPLAGSTESVDEPDVAILADRLHASLLASVHVFGYSQLAAIEPPWTAGCSSRHGPRIVPALLQKFVRHAAEDPSQRERTAKEADRFVVALLGVLEDNGATEGLKQSALSALLTCYREKIGALRLISDSLCSMFRQYSLYPEGLWPLLARAAVEQFALEDAGIVIREMQEKAQNPSAKRSLDYALYRWERKKTN
jgi:hypothetical protein